MQRKTLIWSVCALGLAAFSLAQLIAPEPGAESAKLLQVSQQSAAAPLAEGQVFAASLLGTQSDGKLETSDDRLILNAELLRLFDYYLSTLGQRQLSEIILQVRQELAQRLSLKPQALAQALALFERYLAYKRALTAAPKPSLLAQQSQAALMQQTLAFVEQCRAQYFSADEIRALFADEQARDADAYQRMLIFENKQLSQAQKLAQYQALDQALSPAMRAERNAPLFIHQVEQQVAQMRANGSDEQAIYQFRAMNFSADAAARLTELERDEARWQQRIANYQAQAQQILNQTNAATSSGNAISQLQQAQLARLREQSFSVEERPRLAAYENW